MLAQIVIAYRREREEKNNKERQYNDFVTGYQFIVRLKDSFTFFVNFRLLLSFTPPRIFKWLNRRIRHKSRRHNSMVVRRDFTTCSLTAVKRKTRAQFPPYFYKGKYKKLTAKLNAVSENLSFLR